MTDTEIMGSMKSCSNLDCENCPRLHVPECAEQCKAELIDYALDLINRQTKEIERLQKHNSVVAHKHYNDGIKNFAERIKKRLRDMPRYDCAGHTYFVIGEQLIDNLVKEMVGDAE